MSRRARRHIIKEHLESNPVEMVRLLNGYEWVVDYKEVRKHLQQTTRQRLRRNIWLYKHGYFTLPKVVRYGIETRWWWSLILACWGFFMWYVPSEW